MDRKSVWALVAASAASAALVVHLVVPLVHWEDAEGGTYLHAHEVDDVVGDQLAGAQWQYLLTAGILTAAGAGAVLASSALRARAAAVLGIGGVAASAGGAMALHGNALWAGRGVTTALHAVLGTDAPSKEMAELAASSADFPAAVWPVSAPIVLVLTAVALVATWKAWAIGVADRRGMRAAASRHARAGAWAMLVLALALVVPWSMQVLEDGTTPAEGQPHDTDTFLWSPYDVLRIHEETTAAAVESREAGLVQYEGLALLLQTVAVVGILMVLGAATAIAGTHVATHGEVVWGRLLENSAFVTAVGFGLVAIAAVVGTFWLYDAGDILQSRITGAPLLVLAVAVPGLWSAGKTLRDLVQEDSDPVADDFPEPVVYD